MSRKASKKLSIDPTPWDKEMANFKYKDLKRQVVMRGMPFENVISGNLGVLQGYFRDNFYTQINPDLLDTFDDWMEIKLKEADTNTYDNSAFYHPHLKLGFVGERDEETGEIVEKKRVKGIRRKKEKRTKNEQGIYSGTKKALTYECQKDGLTIDETVEKVTLQFLDANPKSINIWYRKSARG